MRARPAGRYRNLPAEKPRKIKGRSHSPPGLIQESVAADCQEALFHWFSSSEPPTRKMRLEETLALTPLLQESQGEGEARTVPGNFRALWCGTAPWGLTSAATIPLCLSPPSLPAGCRNQPLTPIFGVTRARPPGF